MAKRMMTVRRGVAAMSKALAIYKKEVQTLFVSPIAYVSIALFMFLMSLMVTNNMYTADLRDVFGYIGLFMIFIVPMATMRLWAEEVGKGTHELLLTSPVGLGSIVAGKFLAVMTLVLAIFALTGEYVFLVAKYGKPDWGPIITAYIGMFLLCMSFVAMGVFASSLTNNQFIAAVVTFVLLLFFMVVDTFAMIFPPGLFTQVMEELAIFSHYEDFDKGLLDLANVIFYVGFTFTFLFLTVRNLEARRW